MALIELLPPSTLPRAGSRAAVQPGCGTVFWRQLFS